MADDPSSGWTPDTLMAYYGSVLREMDARYEGRSEMLRQHLVELLAIRDHVLQVVIDALHRELDQRDLRYQQRYDAQTAALEAARLQTAKANEVALNAAEKASDKAEVASNARFASVNEFRAQLADQAATFLPRNESSAKFAVVFEKIEALAETHSRDMVTMREMADRLAAHSDDRLKALESAGANLQGRLWALGAAMAVVVVLVNVLIRFVG